MHKKSPNLKGFTIIEVVLVLAVAGLIFLMVFIALPALNAAQRDTQRRNDAAMVATAVRQYQANNHGKMPPDSGEDVSTRRQYDEGDERHGNTWHSGNDSAALRRYLSDMKAGGVTTRVTVTNMIEKNYPTSKYTIGDEDITGIITVFVGAKCPDMTATNSVVTLVNTYERSNVAIVRYLERGYWYCIEA